MSRFELSGWVGLGGGPLPGEALPDAHSSHTAPLVLQLETGDFHPEEYISFGYTHFEAWCIGGAGGYGGNEVGGIHWDKSTVMVKLSAGDWSLSQELTRLIDRETSGEWDHLYSWGDPSVGAPPGLYTAVQMAAYYNPKHEIPVTTFSNPTLVLDGTPVGYGGGGGGGGLHIVEGLLEDLPQPTPVVVGQVGANGVNGQGFVAPDQVYTPIPQEMSEGFYPTVTNRREELSNYFHDKRYKYPLPHPSFTGGPLAGDDGGTSTFGDVCKASGGKGGGQAIYWPSGNKTPYGPGGAGGLGNQDVAGGGGAGDPGIAPDGGHNGSNGPLDSVLMIGGGGGGGRGSTPGHYEYTSGGGLWGGPSWKLYGNRFPTSGGRGSYSYADTSVWGPGDYSDGNLGGTGGGAHRSGLRFGSNAPGYSPSGAVIVRIFKA
jgi:hypothetical protein